MSDPVSNTLSSPPPLAGEGAAEPRPRKQQFKRDKRDVHGWLVLDKPVGMTSTHAVSVVKRLFSAKRAGHAEGRAIASSDQRPSPEAIRALLPSYTGTIQQVPPRYSAIKIDGERAYDLARDGEVVELEARPVEITRLELIATPDPDHAVLHAECGKGTYVRSLARDMGRALGCFGHVSALRRVAVGPFGEETMILLEQLEAVCHRAAAGGASLADALMPVETALDDIPALAVSRADAARLQRGQAVLLRGRDAPNFRGPVYATASGQLVALAELDRGEIVPKRVFNLAGLIGSAGPKKG